MALETNMAASQSGVFSLQEFSDIGAPLVGGRLYTYVYGTTTHKTAYTDKAGAIPHTYTSDGIGGQYIALNARGELPAPLYLAAGSYDIALKDSTGATIWTRRADPVDDSTASLALDLASTSDASKGAWMSGFKRAEVGAAASTVAQTLIDLRVTPKQFGAVGDGTTNDYAAIVAAKNAAAATGAKLHFTNGHYFIGTNELVFAESGLIVEFDLDAEIWGNGGTDGGYVVSFSRTGGTVQPGGAHPVNQRVVGMRVKTISPFSGAAGRTAVRVCSSYSLFTDCTATVNADAGANGWLLECDDSGSGPYYNTFIECNIQGKQDGATTGRGLKLGRKASTAIASRNPNTNTFEGGRVGGFLVNIELRGGGNRIYGMASENAPAYGTAFKWVNDGANTNASNVVDSPYIENASKAFDVDSGVNGPAVTGEVYSTGVTTLITDPGNHLSIFSDDGIRAVRLASVPNAVAARSGLFVGNTNNADANTLDWYKEGTWTPTLYGFATAGDYSLTFETQSYTRIGNQVTAITEFTVTVNSAGAGDAIFGGLPYPKGSGLPIGGSIGTSNVALNAAIKGLFILPYTTGSTSLFQVAGNRDAATPLPLAITDITTGDKFYLTVQYFA